MRSMMRAAVLPALLAVMVVACGPGGGGTTTAKGTINVGGFNFDESTILAQLYAKVLRNAGYTVNVKASLGNREIVEPALEKGDIDLYPGYAATDLEFVNKAKGEATTDVNETVSKLNSEIASKGLKALNPAPAVDTNAFAVTQQTASKYNLVKISDLVPVAGQLTLGGPRECPQRPFCQAGLKSKYGVNFKAFQETDAGGPVTVSALEQGRIDVGLLFSSDGIIKAKRFTVLQDDKHLQLADNVVPIARTKTVTQDAQNALNQLSAVLTTDDLVNMNEEATVKKDDPSTIAQEYLVTKGLIKK
jgi:osmoprotectant transport system substrate-binding protein